MQKYINHIIFHNSHQYPCHGPTYTFSAKRHTLYGHTVLPALIYQEIRKNDQISTVTVSSVSLIHYTGTVDSCTWRIFKFPFIRFISKCGYKRLGV